MILEQEYNRENFREFLSGFLPDYARDTRDISLSSQQFGDIYSLGSSQNLDLQILEVKVNGSLDKRVSIASDAFKLMKATASYRTLVAFYSEDSKQWRLSLMTAQPTINEGKVVTKLSNPRRFSYLLGPGSKLNTPSKQLITKGQVSDFDDLSKRFALEVVNNEFYKEIAKLYDELVGTDKAPGVLKYPSRGEVSHEFAVRLIGRIIFCWFLREKRSDRGTPLIPASILSRESANQQNYYHTVLAPLFFEVLNKHLKSREEKFQKDEYSTVPYLNGGLFNPDTDDHYRFDKALQLSVPGLVDVPDAWLHKFFDLLELYNFTVDENTSYDIDLSIDPEMLGRIFENLLARINPETGETVRKSTGSFYTPREIVEYMVDQSLQEFLKSETGINANKLAALASFDLSDDEERPLDNVEKDAVTEALSKIKVLDPACGSGAFPIGILQKIVFMLQRVDPDAKLWFEKQLEGAGPELRHHLEREFGNKNFDYLRKLGVIRESIYGVDIQSIATEISRLRCFLTLIVDQSVDDNEQNRGVEPLPNLDFKFVTANSLFRLGEVEAKSNAQTGLFEDRASIDELRDLRDEYFTSHNSERESLKTRFTQVQNKMLRRMLEQRSGDFAETTSKLSAWDPFSHESTPWFDPEWMFGIYDGFDVTIANPPYVSATKLGKKTTEMYRGEFEVATGAFDLFILFFSRGIDLLKDDGILTFITSNKLFVADYAHKIRKKILDKTSIKILLNLADCNRVFNEAAVSAAITVVKKEHPDPSYQLIAHDLKEDEAKSIQSLELRKQNITEVVSGDNAIFNTSLNSADASIIEKMNNDSKPLSSIGEVRTGIMGFEYWKFEPYVEDGDIDHKRSRIINNTYVSPINVSSGKQVRLYKKVFSNPTVEIDSLPTSEGTKILFNNPKVIIRGVAKQLTASLDLQGHALLVAVHSFTADEPTMKFVVGILNSKLMNWYHVKKFYSARIPEGSLKYPISFLKNIPIKNTSGAAKTGITTLVEDVMSTGKFEKIQKDKLNELVYELYELTPGEIKIIEESV